jgi:hypothetical protein
METIEQEKKEMEAEFHQIFDSRVQEYEVEKTELNGKLVIALTEK